MLVVIKLDVVSRNGVLFSDCNATRKDAVISPRPEVVRFDVVKALNQFQVKQSLRHFYQAEVLVPSPLPPEFIVDFRNIRASKRPGGPHPAAQRVIAAPRALKGLGHLMWLSPQCPVRTLSLSGEWPRMVGLRKKQKRYQSGYKSAMLRSNNPFQEVSL